MGLRVERCRCGAACDDYDHRDPGACEGKVLVHDPDDVCPRHECEAHARPPKRERVARMPAPGLTDGGGR